MVTEAPLVYRPQQVAKKLNISTRKVFMLIADGSIKSFLVGRSRMVSADALAEFIRQCEQEAEAGK